MKDLAKRLVHGLKSVFLSGLFTILPIAFTIFALNATYGIIYRSLGPLRRLLPSVLSTIPGAEFILATLLLIALGILLRLLFIGSVLQVAEDLLIRIPFVRPIYSSAKMVVDFFRLSEKNSASKKVVLIQYPRKDNYHLAFLLDSADGNYDKLIPNDKRNYPDEKYLKVFMPHSPNPTSGYFFILPADEVIHTDITFEEAVKTLVSCGLITPDSLTKLQQKN